MADDERQVGLVHLPTLELVGQVRVRAFVLGDDDQARRVLVEPVHDPRTPLAPDTLDVGRMGKDGVREGSIFVSRRGMDGHSRGFVDDDEIIVLEYDGERNLPRLQIGR